MLFPNERVSDAQAPMYDHDTVYLVQFDKGSLLLEQHDNHGIGPIYLKLVEPSRIAEHCCDPQIRELLREKLPYEMMSQEDRRFIVTVGVIDEVPQLMESTSELGFTRRKLRHNGSTKGASNINGVASALGPVSSFSVLRRTALSCLPR